MPATAAEIERDHEALQQPAATDVNALQPDAGSPLTKPEACELLGKSERTVHTYMTDGRLAFQKIAGKIIFQRADVERLKVDLETPIVRGVPAPILPSVSQKSDNGAAVSNDAGSALVRVDPSLTTFTNFAEAFVAAVRPPATRAEPKLWLTAEEASEYSGLPVSYLRSEAAHADSNGLTPDGFIVLDVSMGQTSRWRFGRDSLGGAQ